MHFGLLSLCWKEPLFHFQQRCDLTIFTKKIATSHIKILDVIAYFWYAITPRSKVIIPISGHKCKINLQNWIGCVSFALEHFTKKDKSKIARPPHRCSHF